MRKKTYQINISGIVQGVGFRPFVYNLAKSLCITGFVLNSTGGVEITAQGNTKNLNCFLQRIKTNPPEMSEIDNILIKKIENSFTYNDFIIEKISNGINKNTRISPDIALCDKCRQELFTKSSRRYYYPYINCTNCGPRFTIINNIPYDRQNTVMKKFKMCNQCMEEYNDPGNRRFHAQPNACYNNGPYIKLMDNMKNILSESNTPENSKNLIIKTCELLESGHIFAIKGIGGFHIACNALNTESINRLRKNKNRPDKPLALMIKNINAASKYVHLNKYSKKRLLSPDSPIVLLKKKKNLPGIAPGNKNIGIMLPYTPIQHMIFKHIDFPLVMTSANISGEPIIIDNNEIYEKLNHICDYYITGERDINIACDDSVLIEFNSKDYMIRRSRGIVPNPVKLHKKYDKKILSLGAMQKNTISITKGNEIFLSQHLGDLINYDTFNLFKRTIKSYVKYFGIKPDIIAYDLHPDYLNSKFARNIPDEFSFLKNIPANPIQHHHAHAASCMAENKITDKVIAIVLDGTGYGPDNTIWGGEILIADYKNYKRIAALKPVLMPGMNSCIQNVWKMGLSYIYEVYKDKCMDFLPENYLSINQDRLNLVLHQLKKKYNSILTTSCGRLFDGISAICSIRHNISFEAQAAVELEHSINRNHNKYYEFNIEKAPGLYFINWYKVIEEIIYDLKQNKSNNYISVKFHNGLVKIITDAVLMFSEMYNIYKVVLTGGCFMNMFLLRNLFKSIQSSKKINVYAHSNIPCNDGGISTGQAVIALNS